MKRLILSLFSLILALGMLCFPSSAEETDVDAAPIKAEYVDGSIVKSKYAQNEVFNPEGAKILVTYENGISREIEVTTDMLVLPEGEEEIKLEELGDQTVRVTYKNAKGSIEADVPVTVIKPILYVLPKAGIGMLGIFVVVLVMIATIYGVTIFSTLLSRKLRERKERRGE